MCTNISDECVACILRTEDYYSTQNMEVTRCSEMLVPTYQFTRIHIPEYSNIQIFKVEYVLEVGVQTS
jgi:hypothetical protein